MTVVGDLAQTSEPGGADSWQEMLGPHVGDRFELARLSVNHRTPGEIMAATARLAVPPESVRWTGVPPWFVRTTPAGLPTALAERALAEHAAGQAGGGRLAVIVPDERVDEFAAAVRGLLPRTEAGPDPDLTARVVVLGVRQAKGLEFDVVLIADPAAILAASPRGRHNLYIAMTRATRRLGVICPGPLPDLLDGTVRKLDHHDPRDDQQTAGQLGGAGQLGEQQPGEPDRGDDLQQGDERRDP
jgi:hypothetical protein